MPSLEWLPTLTRVRLEVGRYNELIPATIKVVLQTSRRLESILIQINDSDERYFDRAQVETWGEEDSRMIINDVSLDYNEWRDWEERVADNT